MAGAAALVALILRLGEEHRGLGRRPRLDAAAAGDRRAPRSGPGAGRGERAGDPRQAARLIEARQPELRALLLTAVAQAPPPPGRAARLHAGAAAAPGDRSRRSRALGPGGVHPAAGGAGRRQRAGRPAGRLLRADRAGPRSAVAVRRRLRPAGHARPHPGRARQQRAGAGPLQQAPARPGDAGGARAGQAAGPGGDAAHAGRSGVGRPDAGAGRRAGGVLRRARRRPLAPLPHRGVPPPGGGAHRRPHRVPEAARAARPGRGRRPLPVGGRGGAADGDRAPGGGRARGAAAGAPGRIGAAGRP